MAGNQLKDALVTICQTFAKHEVSYLLIGGTAVALNGYYRASVNASGEITDKPDVDLWFNPTYANYFKVLKGLKDLGHDVTTLESEQSPNPRKIFIKLDFDNFTFDLLPKIKADISFYEAYQRKKTFELDGVLLHIISIEDLILDKKATGRPKDLEDIKHLEKLRGL